jgi:hypothetical protein
MVLSSIDIFLSCNGLNRINMLTLKELGKCTILFSYAMAYAKHVDQ